MSEIDNINHVGMAVRDLADAVARFEAMGFQLTPYSPHSGAWKPGEAVQPLASGNRCVMFANNYLEVLASENAERPNPRLAAFLRRHQGAHIICFNTEAPGELDARLAGAGIKTSGVIPLQREIDTADGVRTAKFERVQFAPENSPEGYIQAARHLTPDYIYQPRYTSHPNGSFFLSETIVAVGDKVQGFAEKYAAYLDVPMERDEGAVRFRLPAGAKLTIASPEQAMRLVPGSLFPPLPAIVAVTFVTCDLVALRRRLTANKFTVTERDGRLVVPAEEACGVAIIFEGEA